ncbi:MAG: hypothetical protein ACFB0G_24095 [Leptolyngbyaceae cyanobacterium]
MSKPISENELLQLIKSAELEMAEKPPIKRFWTRIKIQPQKWSLPTWGDQGGGFWVVALVGQTCIYYNNIEEGFNISPFSTCGKIDEYWCNEDELAFCIRFFYQAFMRDVGGLGVSNEIDSVNAPNGVEKPSSEPESLEHQ